MKLGKFIFKILVFILAQILLVLVIPFFLLVLPIYLYRYVLSKLILVFRKDLTKILTTRSQVLAATDRDMCGKPSYNLLFMAAIEGDIPSPEQEIEYVMKELALLKDDKGNLRRPELQQYITSWMGFYFWKWEKVFNPANHITEYNGPRKADVYTFDDIYEIGKELLEKPFVRRRSPWEVVSLRNCTWDDGSTGRTVSFLHIHHALADGFSLLGLAFELVSPEGGGRLEPRSLVLSTKEKILVHLVLIFKGPYELLYTGIKIVKSLVINRNTFRTPHYSQPQLTHKLRIANRKVSAHYLKEIKLLHGTTFHSVLLAGITGGVRKFMMENEMKIPKSINSFVPIPAFDHPNKLRNSVMVSFITLPVGKKDPKERLLAMGKKLRKLKSSTFPLAMFYIQPLVGGLFPWMLTLASKFQKNTFMATTMISSFPGPSEPVFYKRNKWKCLGVVFSVGTGDGNVGLAFSILSYNGQLRIGVSAHKSLQTKIPLDKLLEYIEDEFDLLKSLELQIDDV